MRGEIDWELLARYVAGECSEQERARVHFWMREDPALAKRVERIRQIWEAADAPSSRWDAGAAWEKVQRGIHRNREALNREASASREAVSRGRRPRPVRHSRERRRRSRSVQGRLLRVTMVVFAVALVVFLASILQEGAPSDPSAFDGKDFATKRGQQATARLADGTEIHLNVESRLVLSEGFTSNQQREVYLEGEAYFDVARDTERPFIVHTEDAAVRVLGTAFDVQAYVEEEAMRVAVVEGEVALRPTDPVGPDTVAKLQPRTLGTVAGRRLEPVRRDMDVSGAFAWREGRLVFENAPFEEVVRKLERWYDLQIETRVPARAVVELNATFEEEPLSEVLHNIAVALNLKYERERGAVTFYR